MKRILIAGALCALTAFVEASSIKWTVNNVYQYGSTTEKAAKGSYFVMCFLAADSAGLSDKVYSLTSASAAASAGKLDELAGKAVYSGTLTLKGQYSSSKYDLNWDGGDSLELFAVVFDATTAAGASHYAISPSTSSVVFDDNAQDKSLTVSMASAAWADVGSGGGDVPEPTSAMLMLLGVAGLALRRKQK